MINSPSAFLIVGFTVTSGCSILLVKILISFLYVLATAKALHLLIHLTIVHFTIKSQLAADITLHYCSFHHTFSKMKNI